MGMHLDFIIWYVIPLLFLHILTFCYIWFKKRNYLVHFLIFVLVELGYCLSNLVNLHKPSFYNHFVHLADALLHGRLFLNFKPAYHDVSIFQGKIFISQPPLPAFLMLPFVFFYGKEFNDILFTIILGALNCPLLFNILLKLNKYSTKQIVNKKVALFLTMFFAFGTVHWYVTVRGTVWHTAHIVTLFFLLLAVNEALGKRRYFLMGLWASLPLLARPPAFCAFPFFMVLGIKDFLMQKRYRKYIYNTFLYISPYIIVGIIICLWNFFRFGNPFDFGFGCMRHAPHLYFNLRKYGAINLHYFPGNATVAFWQFFKKIDTFPYFVPPPEGMAIFFASPLLLYLFRGISLKSWKTLFQGKLKYFLEEDFLTFGALLSVLFTAIPLLLYFNTGWVQFGYRYILDYIPFIIILVAYGMKNKITWVGGALFVISMLMNFYGMLIYIHFVELVF